MMSFNMHSMFSGGLVVRESPSGACLFPDLASVIHFQASAIVDTKYIIVLGPLAHTLD